MKKQIKSIFITATVVLLAAAAVAVSFAASHSRRARVVFRETVVEVEAEPQDDMMNILFFGTDREAGLCDVMMLINVNRTDSTATVAQIPRDTYARYTDGSYKKLNGAYRTLGGASEAADFLADAFGIRIDHYVCIDLDTLCDVVDAMGGVDIELPIDMRYSDPEQGLFIELKKGMTHLDGKLAEQFIRFRSGYADGDIGRMDAQKLFMAAVFSKLTDSFSPVMAARLAAAADGVETDLGIGDLLEIGAYVLEMKADGVAMLTLAGEQAVATRSGASYYVLSAVSCESIMIEHFGGNGKFDAGGVFLNSDYETFVSIYGSEREYALLPVKKLIGME